MVVDLTRDELTLVIHSLRMAADDLYTYATREWGTKRELELTADWERRRQLAQRLEDFMCGVGT